MSRANRFINEFSEDWIKKNKLEGVDEEKQFLAQAEVYGNVHHFINLPTGDGEQALMMEEIIFDPDEDKAVDVMWRVADRLELEPDEVKNRLVQVDLFSADDFNG